MLNSRMFTFDLEEVKGVPFLSSTALRATEPRGGCNSKTTSVLPTDLCGLQVELIRSQIPSDDSIVGRWSDGIVAMTGKVVPFKVRLICDLFHRAHARTFAKCKVPVDHNLPLGLGGLGLWHPDLEADFVRVAHLEGTLLASEDLDAHQRANRVGHIPGYNRLRRVRLAAPAVDPINDACERISGLDVLRQSAGWVNPSRAIAEAIDAIRDDAAAAVGDTEHWVNGMEYGVHLARLRINYLLRRLPESAWPNECLDMDVFALVTSAADVFFDAVRHELHDGIVGSDGRITIFDDYLAQVVSNMFHGTKLQRFLFAVVYGGICQKQLVEWETAELTPWYGVVHGVTLKDADEILTGDNDEEGAADAQTITLIDRSAFDDTVDDQAVRLERCRAQLAGSSRAVRQLDELRVPRDGPDGLSLVHTYFTRIFGRSLGLIDLLQSADTLLWWTGDFTMQRAMLESVNDCYAQRRAWSISTSWWL